MAHTCAHTCLCAVGHFFSLSILKFAWCEPSDFASPAPILPCFYDFTRTSCWETQLLDMVLFKLLIRGAQHLSKVDS